METADHPVENVFATSPSFPSRAVSLQNRGHHIIYHIDRAELTS